jgi:hypothetical protein
LTEAFCIAICEAASSGLLVVSTVKRNFFFIFAKTIFLFFYKDVGGVKEVLPQNMVYLA